MLRTETDSNVYHIIGKSQLKQSQSTKSKSGQKQIYFSDNSKQLLSQDLLPSYSRSNQATSNKVAQNDSRLTNYHNICLTEPAMLQSNNGPRAYNQN